MSTSFVIFIYSIFVVGHILCFNKEGRLIELERTQKAVQLNEDDASAFALRVEGAVVMVSVSRDFSSLLQPDYFGLARGINLENRFLRRLPSFLCAIVGREADCQYAWRFISDEAQSELRLGLGELRSEIALLALADDAQRRSMITARRSLAYNALIFSTSSSARLRRDEAGDILKTDVSGNMFRCHAAGIGKHGAAIDRWMDNRGRALLSERMDEIRSENKNESKSKSVRESQSRTIGNSDRDREYALKAAWSCLKEAVGAEDLRHTILELGVQNGEKLYGPRAVRLNEILVDEDDELDELGEDGDEGKKIKAWQALVESSPDDVLVKLVESWR